MHIIVYIYVVAMHSFISEFFKEIKFFDELLGIAIISQSVPLVIDYLYAKVTIYFLLYI